MNTKTTIILALPVGAWGDGVVYGEGASHDEALRNAIDNGADLGALDAEQREGLGFFAVSREDLTRIEAGETVEVDGVLLQLDGTFGASFAAAAVEE